jgi:hypothetical protein
MTSSANNLLSAHAKGSSQQLATKQVCFLGRLPFRGPE